MGTAAGGGRGVRGVLDIDGYESCLACHDERTIHLMSSYLLIHGGWGAGWVWDDLAERLEKADHEVRVVDQLPSAGTDPASLGDLTTDANYVRQVLDTIDEPVVLVGHSYGGMVITELADHPKVRHTVYLAAFWPRRGPVLAGPAR